MLKHLRPAFVMIAGFTIITGIAYPLLMTGVAQIVFPHQANGSLIERGGKVIGSELIGQNFTGEGYFHGRPSATKAAGPDGASKSVPAPYNAINSGGSYAGPTSKALIARVGETAKKLRAENPSVLVPADLVTTSASGLDPDISPAAALFQIPRIAKVRRISKDRLRQLADENTTGRVFGILGEPRINVLKLNLALDALAAANTAPSP